MAPTIPFEYTGQKELKKCWKTGVGEMMGKTRKVSKGYSSGFVPDYRHAVETTSEGFGSSGRVDTEMTASDDSCAPKRKCISVNGDSHDRFGVPVQVLPLSKMSRFDRKDLERRLRNELEQVRILQRKLASLGSSAVVMSPSSDIRSSSDAHKRPFVVNSHRPLKEANAPPGKKRAAPGRNGPRVKGAGARRPEPLKQALPPNATNVMLLKRCEILLEQLMAQEYSWVFNEPVDIVKLNIPDYFSIIKHPMDLGTIKKKLLSGQYSDPLAFAADVRLTFTNAMTYNPAGNDVHVMAKTLSKYFEVRWKPIEKKIPVTANASFSSKPSISMENKTTTVPHSKKMKTLVAQNEVKQEPVKRVMTDAEKQKLSAELEPLLNYLPDTIIDFLKESSYNAASQANEDEIEIDIDALSDDTLFTLRKLLDDYISSRQKSPGKPEPCEIELHNESGFSNSSVQPCKGNDPADEDVDIGGNDAPISSFPPVEIEKDGGGRNSKCSSSSSSSSDSGSSSSDTDTGSSGDESNGARDQVPASSVKETISSGAKLEQKKSDLGASAADTADTSNDHAEHNSQCKLDSVDLNGCLEGESAPPERQASPDKLYRAALLRSRFADTILKAQEKTLEKGEKLDPEKLRLEREELERRRREEKARLQAEARAAAEARRKAEAEAAAEAKRKRELDREAARQALQKMEKTVDINENSQFLEDLEIFKSAPEQNFMEETIPSDDQNGLGSFKFQSSSNPLEQLGLYMKEDDDEEEEGEPQSVKDEMDDPEEGEID